MLLKGEADLARLTLVKPERLSELASNGARHAGGRHRPRGAQRCAWKSGETIAYDTLFLANGGRALPLPGVAPHPRILTLRTFEDATALRPLWTASPRAGAGRRLDRAGSRRLRRASWAASHGGGDRAAPGRAHRATGGVATPAGTATPRTA